MTIKACETSCGTVYEVECDECGDLFVEGCDSFDEAVAEARLLGRTERYNNPTRAYGRSRWMNYCADCATDMED